MAPEHLRGAPTDFRADVYALGCVLHTTLTGRPPFRRPTVPATITAHLHEPPPRPSSTPGVPVAFDAVVARALAKDPADRYASAGDLGRAALAAAAGEAASTQRGSVARGEAAAGAAVPTAVTSFAGNDAETAIAGSTAVATDVAPAAEADRDTADAPPEPPPRPPTARVHRGRRRRMVRALTALVLAIPATVLIAYVLASPGSASGPLSSGDVEGVARSFADAYSNEDETALRRLLTPGVRRVGTDGVQRGRPAVVAEYRRQFAAGAVERYAIAGLSSSGGRVGRAEGRYTVTRKGLVPLGGRVVLGVVRRDGEPRIDLIATEPRG
jgi:serine/threonine-protein kinase